MNQVVSAEGELPTCQDTGISIAIGKKGENVWTDGNDAEAISKGVFETYRDRNLRYSQVVPYTMFDEKNSGTNLPAQIDLYATQGNKYEFLFITKGGGSANKTFLYQQTKGSVDRRSSDQVHQGQSERPRNISLSSLPSGSSYRGNLCRGLSDNRKESICGIL